MANVPIGSVQPSFPPIISVSAGGVTALPGGAVANYRAQGLAATPSDDYYCQLAAEAAYAAGGGTFFGSGGTVKMVGTFYPTQTFRIRGNNTLLDLTDAIFIVPATWAASGRAVLQLGTNHLSILGGISKVGSTILFTTTADQGAAFFNGDFGYLSMSSTYPTGVNNATRYYVVNYTPLGYGYASCNLALTAGGTPITTSGSVTGTGNLVDYIATTNVSNTLTVTDSGTPTIPNGTPVHFSVGQAAAGLKGALPPAKFTT